MYFDQSMQTAEGADRERTCLAVKPHWFRVIERGAGGLLLLMLGIALILFGEPLRRLLTRFLPLVQVPSDSPSGAQDMPMTPVPSSDPQAILETVFAWGGVALALVGALLLGWALLDRHSTDYAITISPGFGGRIIKVHGVLARQTVAVLLVIGK